MKRAWLFLLLAGCGEKESADKRLPVTCTVGMVADLVREIGGDRVRVTQLMGEGVDPHTYKATARDVEALASARIVFYSGLHLEGKMAELLAPDGVAVAEALDPKTLLDADGTHDPHVWFDVSMWAKTTDRVRDALSKLDPEGAEGFAQRSAAYRKRLLALHEWAKKELATIPEEQRAMVTAHDAFRYFGRAYGIEVKGIQGISTESEAGLKRINDLVEFIVQRRIKAVFVESSVNERSMKSLIEGCAAKEHKVVIGGELFSDAMGEDGTAEGTYEGMVRHNVRIIVEALEMNVLDVHDLTVAYHRRPVLWNVDVAIDGPALVGIVGPNGAGKSTFIKAVLGLVPVASGSVRLLGQPVASVRKRVGYVPQRESVDWDFPVSVLDVALMGTYGRLGWFRRPGKAEREKAMACLERVSIADLAGRQIGQLSGGQQQRTFLARALAQEAEIYFMDEPMAGVDAATEQAVFSILEQLRSEGKTAFVVHHDLRSVPRYFDRVILLNMRLVAAGPTAEAFTPMSLRRAYGGRLELLDAAADAVAGGRDPTP